MTHYLYPQYDDDDSPLSQEEVDELLLSMKRLSDKDSSTSYFAPDKHEWIDTGVPGGSRWCKRCNLDYDKHKSDYCDSEMFSLDLYEEEII